MNTPVDMSTKSTAARLAAAQVKAEALTEALPWIKTFAGATIVIKYGGNAMVSPELQQSFADDIAFLRFAGIRPVVVHGGGPQISAMLKRLGIESEFKAGQRVTTEEAAEVIRMVLSGQVNRDIVSRINQNGDAAIGLSGEDADLLLAHKTTAEAARSALMLSGFPASPPISEAMEQMTGTRPASRSSVSTVVFTWAISPTRPRSMTSPSTSAVVLCARRRSASSPDRPIAASPFWLIRDTMSRLTWPDRTMRMTSAASSVVTRCPALNSDSMPKRLSMAEI